MSEDNVTAHRPSRAVVYLLTAIAVMVVVHWLPSPPPLDRGGELVELTAAGKACLAILGFAVILWVTRVRTGVQGLRIAERHPHRQRGCPLPVPWPSTG